MAEMRKCPTCQLMAPVRVSRGVLIWGAHNDRRGMECPKSLRPVN